MKRRDFLKGTAMAGAALPALPLISWSNNKALPDVEVPSTITINIPKPIVDPPAPKVWIDGELVPHVQDLQMRCEHGVTLQEDLRGRKHPNFGQIQDYVDMSLLPDSQGYVWWGEIMAQHISHDIKIDWYTGTYKFEGVVWDTHIISPPQKYPRVDLTWAAINGIQFEEHS